MSKSTSEILSDNVDKLIVDITERHKAAGQRVTGRTISSLEKKLITNGIQLLGAEYIGVLERGRSAGKVPKEFAEIIKKWIVAKGLSFKDNADLNRFANAIAWKIRTEGTELYRSNMTKDIFTTPIYDFKERLTKELSEYVTADLKSKIFKK